MTKYGWWRSTDINFNILLCLKVVMTQATHLYFDHPQEPDPEERGYYWATRFTNTRKTFGFIPDNLFENVEETRAGGPLTRKELCAKDGMCVDLKQKQNIVGRIFI